MLQNLPLGISNLFISQETDAHCFDAKKFDFPNLKSTPNKIYLSVFSVIFLMILKFLFQATLY